MKEKELTLLILAGGMGSRFGGLKQIEPVGPNNEFIIDYSVYDALKAGFNKIVFLIKKENYDVFKETIEKRVEDKIKVEYAFQELDNLPKGFNLPIDRTKPWGTAHAIMCSKNKINGPFAIINADDFYGRDAYFKMSDFLKNNDREYAIVGYEVENTLSNVGSVKRGVIKSINNNLQDLIESNIEKINNKIIAKPLNSEESFELEGNSLVSMNMIGFNSSIFRYIDDELPNFLNNNKGNILNCEFLIPNLIRDLTNKKIINTKILPTTATWKGITYKEDLTEIKEFIKSKINDAEYPNNLWN